METEKWPKAADCPLIVKNGADVSPVLFVGHLIFRANNIFIEFRVSGWTKT